jgi:hypothetical protein
MIRYPNTFQATIVFAFALIGGFVGSFSHANIGHNAWIVPLLAAMAGALVGLLISGSILLVTNYWGNRRRDE